MSVLFLFFGVKGVVCTLFDDFYINFQAAIFFRYDVCKSRVL
jgi:hypothetical protein